MAAPEVGDQAPPVELPTVDGRRRSLLADLSQGPVLLVFWKTTCRTCDLTFPYLNKLVLAYGESGWRLWAVSQDPPKQSAEYGRRFHVLGEVLVDGEGWPASLAYDPSATPTLYLVAPDGRVEAVSVAFNKEELNDVSRRLAAHLGREPVTVAEPGDGNPDFRPG